MKVLWITRTCPFPATDGEKLRMFHLLKSLAAKHELTVVCRVMNADEQSGLEELRKFCTGGVYGVYIPSPRNTRERLRWLLPFLLTKYPISLCTVFFPAIRDLLRKLSAERRFDIVQVEHSSLTIYLDHVQFQGNPAKVLTMHNVDYLRNERVIENTPVGPTKLYHVLNQARFKRYELQSCERYDLVLAMSELDKQALCSELPKLPVHVVPNGVDCGEIPYMPPVQPSQSMVFVASMDSEANHDGAMFFLDRIFPLVQRRHPEAKISMVGRNPQPELKARDDGRHVIVTGKVREVVPYYKGAAISVVPLRSGGGTRLKILEAMAIGTPVVSTTVGAEGLDVVHGEHLLLADTPEDFAAAVDRLLGDAQLRAALGERARQLVESRYDWALIGQRHDDLYRLAASVAHA